MNKVLALVGRVEVRDWINILQCHSAVQPLGYLAWAATGKDPGLAPDAILQEAGRSARYSAVEIAALAFDGPAPDAADLSHQWHAALGNAAQIVALLPYQNVGQCVLRGENCFAATALLFAKRSHAVRSAFTPARSAVPFRSSCEPRHRRMAWRLTHRCAFRRSCGAAVPAGPPAASRALSSPLLTLRIVIC